jgi:hypothetical protein
MNTAPSSNPFSGLKAMLARILSGGWMGLVLHLLYRRRIEAALTALEDLFAQWKAGTLAPPAVALAVPAAPAPAPIRTTARTPAAGRRGAAPAAARARCPVVAARRPQAAAPRVPATAWRRPAVLHPIAAALYAPHPSRRRARCTKNTDGATRARTL